MGKRPLLLDLFCGAGGCAVGYHRAGFDVIGVDIRPQPRYPFRFVQGDALRPPFDLRQFDAIHASPPCQAYTVARHMNGNNHVDLIAPIRRLLRSSRLPYVIENVPGAPLVSPTQLCGRALGLMVKRHRLFESNVHLTAPCCPQGHRGEWYTVFGDGGGRQKNGRRRDAKGPLARCAMMIDWMNRRELSQAIPPAYTEYIGRQLLNALGGIAP